MPGAFQTCAVSIATESIELQNGYKETGGPAGVAPALWAQRTLPMSVLLATACSAPSCSLDTGGAAASPAPIKVLDWITCKDRVASKRFMTNPSESGHIGQDLLD